MHWDLRDKAPLIGRAAIASICVATILIISKAVAWLLTGSVSMLGSLIDSILDLAASVINFFAIKVAVEPPDKDHRFGHGKAEALAGLFQSSIIIGSAVFLFMESISRLWSPHEINSMALGVGISVLSIILTIGLVLYQNHVVKSTGSVAIEADSLHYKGDLFLNIGVIAALYLSSSGGFGWADGVFGILIALYISYTAFGIFQSSIDMLMDKEFGPQERELIFNLVMESPDVLGIHDLKTRRSGLLNFIQMHVELQPDISLMEAHVITDEIEATVGEKFPNTEIIIHADPFGLEADNDTHEVLS